MESFLDVLESCPLQTVYFEKTGPRPLQDSSVPYPEPRRTVRMRALKQFFIRFLPRKDAAFLVAHVSFPPTGRLIIHAPPEDKDTIGGSPYLPRNLANISLLQSCGIAGIMWEAEESAVIVTGECLESNATSTFHLLVRAPRKLDDAPVEFHATLYQLQHIFQYSSITGLGIYCPFEHLRHVTVQDWRTVLSSFPKLILVLLVYDKKAMEANNVDTNVVVRCLKTFFQALIISPTEKEALLPQLQRLSIHYLLHTVIAELLSEEFERCIKTLVASPLTTPHFHVLIHEYCISIEKLSDGTLKTMVELQISNSKAAAPKLDSQETQVVVD